MTIEYSTQCRGCLIPFHCQEFPNCSFCVVLCCFLLLFLFSLVNCDAEFPPLLVSSRLSFVRVISKASELREILLRTARMSSAVSKSINFIWNDDDYSYYALYWMHPLYAGLQQLFNGVSSSQFGIALL